MRQIRDKELFALLKKLTLKAIVVLTEHSQPVPKRPVRTFSINSRTGYTINEEPKENIIINKEEIDKEIDAMVAAS